MALPHARAELREFPDKWQTDREVGTQSHGSPLRRSPGSNPADLLNASITAAVSAGEYYLYVSGVGKGDPLTTGYTDYGSLGQYWVSGSIVPVDNDFLSIAATDARKAEGDSGLTSLTFTVSRTGNLDRSTVVDFAVAGSGVNAANSADFAGGTLPGGTLTFAPGESSKTLAIQIAGDLQIENDEGFSVTLGNPSSDTAIILATADGLIQNDDAAAPPGISVTPTSGLTTREDGTTTSFSVVLASRPAVGRVGGDDRGPGDTDELSRCGPC